MREIFFNDFIKLNRGFDLPNQSIVPGPNPVVASSTIKDFHKEFKVVAPGVVTGRSGSLGTVQFVRRNFWPLNTSLYVKNFKGNDPLFVSYFLRAMHLENFNSGAGVPTLNQNHLHRLRIRIPAKVTQQKIAAILSAYDDLIANNQRRITLLERMAEDIYREWFVRLRFPGHEDVRREKGVPEGWHFKNLGDVLELCYGKALKDEDRIPGEIPVYGSGGVVGAHNIALAAGPGIVVGRKGNVGSIFWSDDAFFPIDTAYFVRSDTSLYYLFFLLQSMNFINNDAAVPGLNRQQAYSNKLLFPPKELVNQFTSTTGQLFKMRRLLAAKSDELKATRAALLPRLISGKLAVDDLDIQFPPDMANLQKVA